LEYLDWHGFLARPPLPSCPLEVLDALRQEPILITGAGGSIGSALARRLAALAPPSLLLLDASERHLYSLEREQAVAGAAGVTHTILGSAGDRTLLEEVFARHRPRIVFHAAAFKHVPLMEAQPLAAVANNIFVTRTLASVTASHGARVILLSTDKAVEPASVMGATKRVAEQIVLASGGTVLRLGNVLASSGSVAEIFARQIALGGSVTVTSPAAKRYFLTMNEAVNLLTCAAALDLPSSVLAPILPVKHFIADLAQFMARILAPDREIAIGFTEPRPGDKEDERMWSTGETTRPCGQGGLVLIEAARLTAGELNRPLAGLRIALDARDLAAALGGLCTLVPDYTPSRSVLALARRDRLKVEL
jgi:FlaA1/EpsC-like NDP-sugar epimerase